MVKSGFYRLLIITALLPTWLLGTPCSFLDIIKSAIAAQDVEKVYNMLPDSLTLAEKSALQDIAQEFIDKIRNRIEEPPAIYCITLGLLATGLGLYLAQKQLPRLRGHIVEYNSPRITYVGSTLLLSIGTFGFTIGFPIALQMFYEASNGQRAWLWQNAQALVQANEVAQLIDKIPIDISLIDNTRT